MQGVLKVGDEIEIRPGHITRNNSTKKLECKPIRSRIVNLRAEKNDLLYAVPGGLIGITIIY